MDADRVMGCSPSGALTREAHMGRYFIDCREMPSDRKCTLAMAADTEKELMEAAVQHAVAMHGHKDTPELRSEMKKAIHQGTPPAAAPRAA
ncbi:putative small metal-binding protein [Ancylobacter sp. 3268]|nr:putative small metal-binding protein [Ancylobacter sp. 3268]